MLSDMLYNFTNYSTSSRGIYRVMVCGKLCCIVVFVLMLPPINV